jgi:hypothetical protein
MAEDFEKIEDFEAKETARKLPAGWIILFWALIVWGVAYLWLYTPGLGGWSQEKAYQESVGK